MACSIRSSNYFYIANSPFLNNVSAGAAFNILVSATYETDALKSRMRALSIFESLISSIFLENSFSG